MNNNFDPLFAQYADTDFAKAKPVAEVPALAKLQADHGGISYNREYLNVYPGMKSRSVGNINRHDGRKELHHA